MKPPSAIIVGAGIGGLATAIKLAKQGVKVTVFEKNSKPGGRCQRIIRAGHIFDNGPTMYIFPEIYRYFFSSIGEDQNHHLTLLRVNPTYRLNFADKTHLNLSSDSNSLRLQLEKLEPGSYKQFLAYLKVAQTHYDITLNHILNQRFASPLDFFKLNYFRLLKSRVFSNHYRLASQYFHHPHLIAAFTFQDSYLSLNPFEAQAIYSCFAYTEHTHGNFLPQGGMYQVIEVLANIARQNGVRFFFQHEVKHINTQNNQVTGITLLNHQVKTADYYIINADLTYAYQKLLPYEPFTEQLSRKKYSCSALVFHWGVKKVYPQLQTHNLFFSDSYRAGFDQVLNRATPPNKPHFYVQAPSRTDPTRAPTNQDTLSVMIPLNHLYPSNSMNWPQYQKQIRQYVLDRLAQTGLTDLRTQIRFEIRQTPLDWCRKYCLPFGAIYGLHHNLTQLGPFRPPRIHRKYKNLYFVGASTHPGSGLPSVLLSAQYTSEAIIKHISQRS